jgi:peptidoglycan hydrolase-like protein with peptidoglycan-binding domain/tetratricopeptide (TPR) repeat protein
MSRSKWAWMEGCEPVSVLACGAGERARPEARFGRGSLGAVSSTKRLVGLMAAGVLLIGAAPASALAGSASGSHTKLPSKQPKQQSARVTHAVPVMLALGRGYSAVSGDAGVRALQRRLANAGYAPGPVDGRYGPRTEQAVSGLQAARGLGVDGIAGPLTLAALRTPSRVLYPGTGYAGRGSGRVRVLQRRLAKAGFAPGPIDGRYGPRTEQAVTRFQTAHGLGADGIAGPQTLARLGNRQPTSRRRAVRPSGPVGSRQRAHRRPHRQRSRPPAAHRQPGRAAAPGTLPASHSTSTPSMGLLVLLIALAVALGLAAIRIVRRCREQRYAGIDQAAGGAARSSAADAIHADPNPTPTPDPATAPIPDLAETDDGDRAFRQALMLEQRGDPRGAMAAYQQADRLGHSAAACNLGALLAERGELTAAEASFRRAAERGDAHGAANLAVLHEDRGDLTGAIAAYQQADRLGHGASACNLGVLLEQHGDLAAAEAAFRRAAERGDTTGAFNLGVLLEGQGDSEGALRAYEHAERLGDPPATADMARAAARELRSQIENPIAAKKGGDHDGR